jgi:hypothetical protein
MNPRRKKILSSLASVCVVSLCLFGMVALERVIAQEALSEAMAYYIVREGDTLWDITNHFYEDPYLWPIVWGHNTHIANPHWIYPGDPIYLASIAGEYLRDVATMEAPPEAAAERPAPSPVPTVSTLFVSRQIADTALLTAEAAGATGRVLAARDRKHLLAQGDEVYLQLPEGADPAYKGPYQVLRGLRQIRHPQTGENLGTLYTILGYTRAVGQPQEGVAKGKIVASQDAIEVGDLIRKGSPPPKEVFSSPAKRELEGWIVAGLRTDDLLAEYDVVFIDKGVDEGVEVGDTFWVLEPPRRVENPSGMGKITLPDTRIGVLVVILAEKGTSTALVTNSEGVMSAGDRIRSRVQ